MPAGGATPLLFSEAAFIVTDAFKLNSIFICIVNFTQSSDQIRASRRTNTRVHANSALGEASHKLGPVRRRVASHPGIGGAAELVPFAGRPPGGGVEIHVVGFSFEAERLAGVAVRGGGREAARLVLVVLLAAALWGRQVHSVAVVVLPVSLVVKWLCVLGGQVGVISSKLDGSWRRRGLSGKTLFFCKTSVGSHDPARL